MEILAIVAFAALVAAVLLYRKFSSKGPDTTRSTGNPPANTGDDKI
ncbi:hypothetical protein ACLMAL_36935 [Nocardia sp. CWNU-33]